MVDLPVVCTVSSAALKARRQNLLGTLWARAAAIHDVANGYRLKFAADADMLSFIAQTIDAERQCCRFLRFQVTVEPDGGPVWLDLTGPPGAREFLAQMIEG